MSTETKGLAELYDSAPAPAPQGDPAPAAVTTGEGQAPASPPSASPQDAPPASDGKPPSGYAPVAALEDERRKRQRLERDYQELQRRVMAPSQTTVPPAEAQAKAKAAGLPDPITHPEEFEAALMERAVAAAEAKAEARFRERDDEEYSYRADESEEAHIAKHGDDYHAKKQAFVEELNARRDAGDDSLGDQLRKSRNPAAFAYKIGSEILRYREIGNDPAAYDQKVIDRYLASQNGGQQPAAPAQGRAAVPSPTPQRQAPAVPKSLAGVTSAGPRTPGNQPIKRLSMAELYDQK